MPLSNSLIELYVDVIECKRVCMSVCVCVYVCVFSVLCVMS